MEKYIPLAIKYRPKKFKDFIGQDSVIKIILGQLKQKKINNNFLFLGTRGSGKTSLARVFASSLNCENIDEGFEPCGECDSCLTTRELRNLNVIEIDGASSSGKDDIKKVIEELNYVAVGSRYKVIIIDECHALSTAAWQTLLKPIEDGIEGVIWVFASTEGHKIPATIKSRCTTCSFLDISIESLFKRLKEICENENFKYEDGALNLISKKADGSHRDSQTILDSISSFNEGDITISAFNEITNSTNDGVVLEIIQKIGKSEKEGLLNLIGSLFTEGKDLNHLCSKLIDFLRDIYYINEFSDDSLSFINNKYFFDDLLKMHGVISSDEILNMIDSFAELKFKFKQDSLINRIIFETALIKSCKNIRPAVVSKESVLNFLKNILSNKKLILDKLNDENPVLRNIFV